MYDDLCADLSSKNLAAYSYPHGSNLTTKSKQETKANKKNVIERLIPPYLSFFNASSSYESSHIDLKAYLNTADSYYDLIKHPDNNVFSHQSDFVSSLLPEILCSLFRKIINQDQRNLSALNVVAQKDILIECSFDISGGGRIIEKRKRMDVCILLPTTLQFNSVNIDFFIPVICSEIKTNIDKNMLSGIEASVEALKKTFPCTKYYAIGEYSDFDISSQNYASTGIDEILIARNQRRSEVRRNQNNRNPLSVALFEEFISETVAHLAYSVSNNMTLSERMLTGRLT